MKGEAVIAAEVEEIPNETARKVAKERLVKIANGERDFRFWHFVHKKQEKQKTFEKKAYSGLQNEKKMIY